MNFFEHQDRARTNTVYLVFLFTLAVAFVIAAVYLLFLFGFNFEKTMDSVDPNPFALETLWQPTLFYKVAGGLFVLISFASLFKIWMLSNGGGAAVAEHLGGRKVDPGTTDLGERQLLNVVEEIAIASGTPVPSVYVLDDESTINAFAAGMTPGNSVIAVTRGTLGFLNREELQGVIAHEFSHIVNGDVKLNIRLMGLLNGILFLALIGKGILRSSGRSSRGRKSSGGQAALVGLGLYVIGYIGVFFANLIKSAVSRQREFLADASAVQFTRNPDGISGALKKIGGCHQGRNLVTSNAEEASHMLFDSFASFDWLATHPPLVERIRVIDPKFNGQFVEPQPTDYKLSKEYVKELHDVYRKRAFDGGKPSALVGQMTPENLATSVHIINSLDQETVHFAHDVVHAQALVFAFLVYEGVGETYPSPYTNYLEKRVDPAIYSEMTKALPRVAQTSQTQRMALIELSFPALRSMSLNQYEAFKLALQGTIMSDNKIHLFEFCLSRMLTHYLDQHFYPRKSAHPSFSLKNVWKDIEMVVSTVSYYGSDNETVAVESFKRALEAFGSHTIKSKIECTLENFEIAVRNLQKASPKIKKQVIDALGTAIRFDSQITISEYELMRTVSSLLDCPMPPITLQ